MQPVRFHFDFVSPYSYVAWTQVHALGERIGRAIEPVPFFLGGVPKAVGSPAPAFNPPKARYILKDCARKARVGGVPFEPPAAVDDRARGRRVRPPRRSSATPRGTSPRRACAPGPTRRSPRRRSTSARRIRWDVVLAE